jgi:predicted Ser/Thr protein kinase
VTSRWRQINDVFHAALEREGETRAAYLREATAGDDDLRREVESLLASHNRSGTFLQEPAWGVGADLILGPHQSLVGRQVGSYRVIEEIGRGGMGVVYAAEDQRLGRTVALKALTPEFTRDRVRRERLTREARAAASLSHPAIATIFALEEIDGELYIVSELVRGRTLREELSEGPVPVARLHSTLVDIASALAAAHEHGIVHRDLKPENIMRRTDGQIKILDFGLARNEPASGEATLTHLTEAGVALGTPGYMAPEQLAGGTIDARADLFAFGVVAWELSTGEHPFGTDPATLLARMTELLEGRSAPLSRPLPLAGLDRIARRCLRAKPAERYSSSAELLADLQALTSTTAASAATPAPNDGLWWWQFHQAAVAIVNALLPVGAWFVRRVDPALGSWTFFLILALATISVTLRLNLLFTSRVHASSLAEQRRRTFPAIVGADAVLYAVVLAGAAAVAWKGTHDSAAAILLIVGLVGLASLVLIEPGTARAAQIDDARKS